MNFLKKISCLSVLAVGLTSAVGQFTSDTSFFFPAEQAPVWDVSGQYVLSTPILGAGDSEIRFEHGMLISVDPVGRIAGQGDALVRVGDDTVAAAYTIKGSVSGGGDLTRVNFTVSLRGRDYISGQTRKFSFKSTYKLEVDPAGNALVGSVRGGAAIEGAGSGKIYSDNVVLPLPGEALGSWFLDLDYLALGKITGIGVIAVQSQMITEGSTADLRGFSGTVKGSYSAKKDLSKVSFKGINEGRGITLNISWYGEGELDRLSGKILGQKVRAFGGSGQ